MTRSERVGRVAVTLVVAAVAAVVAWVLFVALPGSLVDLFGVLLVLAVVVLGARLGGSLARTWFPGYNVAEVAVEGPITRDGGRGPLPGGAVGTPADDIVEQIERADDDPNAEALLVRLNTPGGEVVPSDDIRLAAESFDGPTVAHATDTCASGGYWIASGCDELWARKGSIVGSIGVIGSRPNVSELADRLGVSYERFAAGRYKDAGLPLKSLSDEERSYLQGIVDDYYDQFVETVAEGREMDPESVRETEARVYLGAEAEELGLVDAIGTDEAVEDRLGDLVGAEARLEEFRPSRRLAAKLRMGAAGVAYALGAGIADQFDPGEGFDFRL